LVWATLSAAGLIVSACSSTVASRSTAENGSAGDRSLESLLSAMPTSVDFATSQASPYAFVLGNVDAAIAASGLARPGAGTATDDEVRLWLRNLSALGGTGAEPAAAFEFPFPLHQPKEEPIAAAAALGWSLLDVHAFVWDLSGTLTVLDVDTTPARLTAALGPATDGVWAIGHEAHRFNWTPRQPEFMSVRMAGRDGLLACGGSDAAVKALLAGGPTLADNASFVEVTRALDAVGAYAAVVLAPDKFSIDAFIRSNPRASQAKIDERLQQLVPNAFDALGIGYSVQGGERLTSFVYHHADAAEAAANAPILEALFKNGLSLKGNRRFGDSFTVQSVVTTGDLVTVTVSGSAQPLELILQQENMTVSQ